MSDVVYIDLYRTRVTRQWRWRAVNAGNSRKLAHGGEAYWNRQDALDAIAQLFGPDTVVYKRETEMGNVIVRHPEPWPSS